MSSTVAPAPEVAAKPPAVPEATPPGDSSSRSRETFRGRERETR
jgi:hypothetical protein